MSAVHPAGRVLLIGVLVRRDEGRLRCGGCCLDRGVTGAVGGGGGFEVAAVFVTFL